MRYSFNFFNFFIVYIKIYSIKLKLLIICIFDGFLHVTIAGLQLHHMH